MANARRRPGLIIIDMAMSDRDALEDIRTVSTAQGLRFLGEMRRWG